MVCVCVSRATKLLMSLTMILVCCSFRLHRMHPDCEMRPADTDWVALSVCPSVRSSVCWSRSWALLNQSSLEMPFGGWRGWSQPCVRWGEGRTNPFAAERGDKLSMWPFVKLLWTLVIFWQYSILWLLCACTLVMYAWRKQYFKVFSCNMSCHVTDRQTDSARAVLLVRSCHDVWHVYWEPVIESSLESLARGRHLSTVTVIRHTWPMLTWRHQLVVCECM